MRLLPRHHAPLPVSLQPHNLAPSIASALAAVDARLRSAWSSLSAERRNARRADGGWSVREVLEHIALTNEAYLAPIHRAAGRRYGLAIGPHGVAIQCAGPPQLRRRGPRSPPPFGTAHRADRTARAPAHPWRFRRTIRIAAITATSASRSPPRDPASGPAPHAGGSARSARPLKCAWCC